MMKIKIIYVAYSSLLFALFIFTSNCLVSQDVHFSQYNGSVLNLNPSFTGFFDGNYRLSGIYRSQWSSVPVPYKTISLAADGRFKTKNMKSDCFGAGILFNNDKSGDANYGTTQLYFSGSYIHKLNKDSTLLWSTGITAGISHVGFNYSKMTFDDQYQGSTYNASATTGENFSKNSAVYSDLNIGTILQYSIKQRAFVQYGISFHHLTSPKLSFQNNTAIKIDLKLNNYICFAYPIGAQTDVVAELLVAHQGKYNELVPGAQLKVYLNQATNQTASLGIYYRIKDAAIARVGYQYKTLTAGISYDVNTSQFIAATNRRGAFELYLTYIFKKTMPFVPKTRVCPVYM